MAETYGIGNYRPLIAASAIDGASRYAEGLCSWLTRDCKQLIPHRLYDMLASPSAFEKLRECTVVVSLLGPYAYLYSYWREVLGLNFKLVRHVHSAFWIGDLTQEWLCRSLDRPGDAIVFPSAFAEAIYAAIFGYGQASKQVLHPRFDCQAFPEFKPPKLNSRLKFAIVGRLSHDKNILDALLSVQEFSGGMKSRPIVTIVGGEAGLSWPDIQRFWTQNGGEPAHLNYIGNIRSADRICDVIRENDLLIFFSTSNIESLGRVVIEARYNNTRYCVADWAAAREIAAPDVIARTQFAPNRVKTHIGTPLGAVSAVAGASAIDAALHRAPDKDFPSGQQRYLYPVFRTWLMGDCAGAVETKAEPVAGFHMANIESLRRDQALDLIRKAIGLLACLEQRDIEAISPQVINESIDKERTQKFLCDIRKGALNYADLGGYPFHIANHLGFSPDLRVDGKNGFAV